MGDESVNEINKERRWAKALSGLIDKHNRWTTKVFERPEYPHSKAPSNLPSKQYLQIYLRRPVVTETTSSMTKAYN